MTIGYIRVSTEEQNTARQEEALVAAGAEKLFIDKISGKNTKRPMLNEMLSFIREGDTLLVESYSRLARSTTDLLNLIANFEKKKINFISLKENIDTTTPQGRLILTIFAGLSQFERECLLQRQREGIEIAKREGKYKGRQPIKKPDNWETLMIDYKAGKIKASYAIKQSGLKSATFYRKVHEGFKT